METHNNVISVFLQMSVFSMKIICASFWSVFLGLYCTVVGLLCQPHNLILFCGSIHLNYTRFHFFWSRNPVLCCLNILGVEKKRKKK